jgi:hypothetical protein
MGKFLINLSHAEIYFQTALNYNLHTFEVADLLELICFEVKKVLITYFEMN